jgi:hypothetical protein
MTRLETKVDRRRFLKYIGASAVAVGGAAAAYYLYNTAIGQKPEVSIPTTTTTKINTPPAVSEIKIRPVYINPTTEYIVQLSHDSYDPDGDPLITTWLIDWKEVSHEHDYSAKLPEGDHSIVLKVSDGRSVDSRYATLIVDADQIYPAKPLYMKYKGVRYSAAQQTPEWGFHTPSNAEMDEQLDTIHNELGCNAIYINAGKGFERNLIECGHLAIEKGFDRIYIQPAYMNLPSDETIELIGKFAEKVTDLTDVSDAVILSVGHEFTLETSGIIPGDNWFARADYQLAHEDWYDKCGVGWKIPKLFQSLMHVIKEKYPGRRIAYAAAIWEVDLVPWSDPAFEAVGTDAYVMDSVGITQEWIFDHLSRAKRYGKPINCTETGCMTFTGAYRLGGVMPSNVWQTGPYDEDEQAKYIQMYCSLLNRARINGYFYTQYNDDLDKGYGLYNPLTKKRKKGFYMYKSYQRSA